MAELVQRESNETGLREAGRPKVRISHQVIKYTTFMEVDEIIEPVKVFSKPSFTF